MNPIWIAGSISECAEVGRTGVPGAIVTNPTVVADWCRDGMTFHQAVRACLDAVPDLPLFIQLRGPVRADYLDQAAALRAISERVVPKLPATVEALAAVKTLAGQGVDSLVTTVCSLSQASLAAAADAAWICPYWARVREAGGDPARLIREASALYRRGGHRTRIVPASIRSVADADEAFEAGADGVIVFHNVFREMHQHPLMASSLASFERDDWSRIPQD